MTMKTNRYYHAVQSAFACLTGIMLQPSKTCVIKQFASLLIMLGILAVGNAIAATYTWDGGNATGNWSLGGADGNWTGGVAPASSTANALVFQSNSNGQIANNDIGTSFDVDTLTFNVSGMTLSGGSIRFSTATANKMVFGVNAVTFNNNLELAADTTLTTSTANPIVFNGQLTGPGKLTYVNTGTSYGTLFKFASSTANTINGFTLGNGTTSKGRATIQIAMDDPFGGVAGTPTTLNFNNSGDVTLTGMTSARVISSAISCRNNITFTGKSLTFRGGFSISSTGSQRTLANNLDAGEVLTIATDPGAIFNSANGTSTLVLTGGSSAITAIPGVVSDGKMMNSGMTGYSGLLRLTGANTYTSGNIAIANWTLEFNSVENKGSATASALGKPTVNGTNEVIALGSTTTAGTLKYIGTSVGGHSTDRLVGLAGTTGGATLDASGTGPISFTAGTVILGAGSKTLTLQGSNTGNNTLGGVISNSTGYATSLVKDGAGTWLLTGANTYTGTTTVKGGNLLVNGSLDAATAVTVTNATLGGTGTLNGNLTVQNNGSVAPGTSVGSLTSNLSGGKAAVFEAGAKLGIELDTPGTSDTLAFTGLTASTTSVTFNNNVINFSNAGSWGAGTYTLVTFDANNVYSGTLTIGTGLEAFDPTTHLVHNADSIQLVVVESASKPTVTIAKTTDGAEEGPVNGLFTVTRDTVGIANLLTVAYTVTGTATSGSDYTARSGNVTIDASQTSATITVPVLQDNDFSEGTETVIVTLTSDAAYTVGAPANATVEIADGTKPAVTVVKTTDGAEVGPINGVFTVSRPAGETTNFALTVNYTVDGASIAASGSDYTALSGSVVIGVGQTQATVTVPVLQDTDFAEGTENVSLNLSADAAYTLGAPNSATVEITDGSKPSVTLAKTTDGAEAGPVNGLFTVTRSTANGTANPLTVTYATDGASTATSGSDYAALSGSVIIGTGQTSATIPVTVVQDTDFAEGTENVILNLSAGAAYDVGTPGSATVQITDGIQPVVNIVKTLDGSEVGPVNGLFTVSRSLESASSGPVTVYFTTNSSTAAAGSDYTAFGATNVTLASGVTNATLPVYVWRDGLTEGAEYVQLTLLANSGYTIGASASATVEIEDDNAPAVGERGSFAALYTFSNAVNNSVVDPTVPPYEKGVIFGAFSMSGYNQANTMQGAFYPRWINLAQQSMGSYFEVELAPVNGVHMTLTNITFKVARINSGGLGPTNWAVRASLDSYETNLTTVTINPSNANLTVTDDTTVAIGLGAGSDVFQTGTTLSLGSRFENLTNSVTFRVYVWGIGSNAKTGGMDDFQINGTWVRPAPRGTMISFH